MAGKTVRITHDGFVGDVIGSYTTREGKRGVVLQQVGTRVVHVYGAKWLTTEEEPMPDDRLPGYRELNEMERDSITNLKQAEAALERLLARLYDADPRHLALARTHFETGFMFAVKAVAKPRKVEPNVQDMAEQQGAIKGCGDDFQPTPPKPAYPED